MGQLDRLQQDAAHLKEELHTLASQLEQRTSDALHVEEQAQLLVREIEQEANHKVHIHNVSCTMCNMQCIWFQLSLAFGAN